jgi:hypothetical protein
VIITLSKAIPFTTPVERMLLMMLDRYLETDAGKTTVDNHMRAGQTVLAYRYRVQVSAEHPNYVFSAIHRQFHRTAIRF